MATPKSKCVILTPFMDHPETDTNSSLDQLEKRGYRVVKFRGCPYIDQVRSILATWALKEGYEELMWVDCDIAFDPDAIEVLRSHDLPLVCGLFPKKSKRGGIASVLFDYMKSLTFGDGGGLIEIKYAATGFLYTKSVVYNDIVEHFTLPTCDGGGEDGIDFIPFFQQMIYYDKGKYYYMGEDTSFCERARQCGYRIFADTRIRLGHIGKYTYSWEDIVGDRPRFTSFEVELNKEVT